LFGQYLNIELSRRHDILTLYNNNIGNCSQYNSNRISITDKSGLLNIFKEFRPEVIVHTAAISKPDLCEKAGSQKTYEVNVEAAEYIANLSNEFNARMVFTSTDLVYDGNYGGNLSEDAKINPLTLYAETKIKAEEKIKAAADNYIIVRIALMYGYGLNIATCHFHECVNKLKENKKITLFGDQYRSALSLIDSARMVREIIEKNITGQIINMGGNEKLSRYELFEKYCSVAGISREMLVKDSVKDAALAKSPIDVSMNINKLKVLGIVPKSPIESMKEIIEDYETGR